MRFGAITSIHSPRGKRWRRNSPRFRLSGTAKSRCSRRTRRSVSSAGQRGNALVDMYAHAPIPVANARVYLGYPTIARSQGEPVEGRDAGIAQANTSLEARDRPRVGATQASDARSVGQPLRRLRSYEAHRVRVTVTGGPDGDRALKVCGWTRPGSDGGSVVLPPIRRARPMK